MAVGNMLRVLKGNQETLISPEHKEKYLKDGYSVIEEDGRIVEQGMKSERTIRNELEAAQKRIKELEEENAQLKAKASKKSKKDGEQEEKPDQAENKSGLAGD